MLEIVRLGIVRLGIVRLGILRLGIVRLGNVRLGIVKLGISEVVINHKKLRFNSTLPEPFRTGSPGSGTGSGTENRFPKKSGFLDSLNSLAYNKHKIMMNGALRRQMKLFSPY